MIEDPSSKPRSSNPKCQTEDDLQLREAINIAKDMVYIQSQNKDQVNQIGEVAPNGQTLAK